MNVFLIQPPAAAPEWEPLDTARGQFDLFAPPWNLLCLQSFLQKHTRHVCQYIDCRLAHDLEKELIDQLEELPPPRMVVVNCPILALGQVSAVLEITKRHYPAMRTVICGEFPTRYPDHVTDIPRVDYALSGDPEPILRNLLDYLDVPQRLRRTPGLIMPETTERKPYWVPRLVTLALPDWDGYFWRDYAHQLTGDFCRSEMRITRGHSGLKADRAFGGQPDTLREWPMERLANTLSRSAHTEIKEVMLTDPPGFWNPDRLKQWAQSLLLVRNVQFWSLAMYPTRLDYELIADLFEARCSRIDFIVPSCDPEVLAAYGLKWDWQEWQETLQMMRDRGIKAFPRFWIGSPEESAGESQRIADRIRQLQLLDYRVEPFPYVVDSPLYSELREKGIEPDMREWIRWSRDPWIENRPVRCWGGPDQLDAIKKEIKHVQHHLQRSPGMAWARIKAHLGARNWIEAIEDKALSYLQRNRNPNLSV